MLAATPLKNEREREVQGGLSRMEDREIGDDSLLDAIDFDDLLLGDVLPHFEMDSPFFAEFETGNNSPNSQEEEAAPDSISDPVREPERVVEKEKSPARCKNKPGKKKAKVRKMSE